MDPHILRAFYDELEQPMLKQALIDRLIRLGATDLEDLPGVRHVIKKTPRLFMRKRSPEELHAMQESIAGAITRAGQPFVNAGKAVVDKTPVLSPLLARSPKLHQATHNIVETMIRNPDFALAKASPIPGSSFAYLAGKKGLEKAIDKWAPAMLPPIR